MRTVVSGSSLIIIMVLIIMIHNCLLNKNYRDTEVNIRINDAFDYALDKLQSEYASGENDDIENDEIIGKMMRVFCDSFSEAAGSDGIFKISLVYADLQHMLMDIVVEDEFSYGYMNRTGKSMCERTIKLNT